MPTEEHKKQHRNLQLFKKNNHTAAQKENS